MRTAECITTEETTKKNNREIEIQETTSWFLPFQVNNTLVLTHTHTTTQWEFCGCFLFFMNNFSSTRNVQQFLWRRAIENKWIEEITLQKYLLDSFIHSFANTQIQIHFRFPNGIEWRSGEHFHRFRCVSYLVFWRNTNEWNNEWSILDRVTHWMERGWKLFIVIYGWDAFLVFQWETNCFLWLLGKGFVWVFLTFLLNSCFMQRQVNILE